MLKKKLFYLFSLVLIVTLLLPITAWAGSEATGGDVAAWEQFRKDVHNSGLATSPAPIADITMGWRQQVQVDNPQSPMAGANVTPLVAENKVFVLDARGGMWAFNAKTGVQLWKTNLSCTGWQFQLATPAYASGKLFVATNDGHVYALAAGSGNIIWDKIIADKRDQLNTPVKYADGKVYVDSWGNKTYYCLDASNGEILWQRESTTGSGYYWAGACVTGNYLIFGDDSAVLTCLNKDSGEMVDEKSLKVITTDARKIHSSVTYSHQTNRVYFTDEGGHCWAFNFDPRTGKLTYAWHKKIGRVTTSTPAVYNDKVYVGTGTYVFQGDLYCLEGATGKELWKFTPTGIDKDSKQGIQSSPSLFVQNDKVYIYFISNYENATVYCLDENGNKLWEFTSQEAGTSGGYTTSSVAIAGGWVYFGNDGGWVYALTGASVNQKPLSPPIEVKELQPPAFSDLPTNHWAKEVILGMMDKDIFKGYPDGTCRPDKTVTRAEFVSLLLRTVGLNKEEGKTVDFSDVKPGDWYYRDVALAYHYGLAKGYVVAAEEEHHYFRPNAPVTREQVAVMLRRALEFKKSESEYLSETKVNEILAHFNDRKEISFWAKEAVAIAVAREIVQGYPGNLFKPLAGATRAECAAMLKKFIN